MVRRLTLALLLLAVPALADNLVCPAGYTATRDLTSHLVCVLDAVPTPQPTATIVPIVPTATPKPNATVVPTATPKVNATPQPTATPPIGITRTLNLRAATPGGNCTLIITNGIVTGGTC